MTSVVITPGILPPPGNPPPGCYASEQARFEAYVAAFLIAVSGNDQWIVQADIPGPDDTDLLWLKLDADTRPVAAFKYVVGDAAWVPWLVFPTVGTTTGSGNAYSLTNSPAFTTVGEAYSLFRTYTFKSNFATTGASTLDIDGLGAKAIKVRVTEDTGTDTIKTDQIVTVFYDGVNFQMVSAASSLNISVSDILPGTVDGQFLSTVLISSGPDVFATVWKTRQYKTAEADAQAIPAGGTTATFNHGLVVRPKNWSISIVLTDAGGDLGYSQGTEIKLCDTSQIDPGLSDDNAPTVWADNVVIGFQSMVGSSAFRISDKSTGAVTAIDPTKWKLLAFAEI